MQLNDGLVRKPTILALEDHQILEQRRVAAPRRVSSSLAYLEISPFGEALSWLACHVVLGLLVESDAPFTPELHSPP